MIFGIHDTILNILDILAKSLPKILVILHFPANYYMRPGIRPNFDQFIYYCNLPFGDLYTKAT